MSQTPRIAIIGGSKEAVDLARALAERGAGYCLFETPFYPSPDGLETQRYDDGSDWAALLSDFDALVFAPHPFAFSLLDKLKNLPIPTVALLRKAWAPTPADNWLMVETCEAAAETLQSLGASRPLLALGRERLAPFIALQAPELLVRCRNLPRPDLKGRGRVEYMTGPFTVDQEIAYLQQHGIDCIIVHNAGGQGGWPKLEAARRLSIPVIMVDRPQTGLAERVETPGAAQNWLRQTVGLDV